MAVSQVYSAQIRYSDSDFLTIKDTNRNLVHNIQALFNRKKGTIFRVDEEGRLKKVSGLCSRIKYWWRGENRAVQTVVSKTLLGVDRFLGTLNDESVSKRVVREYLLTDSCISRLSSTVFERRLLMRSDRLKQYSIPENTVRFNIGKNYFHDFQVEGHSKSIVVDLGSQEDNHNFWMLLQKRRGEVYQIDAQGKFRRVIRHLHRDEKKAVQAVATKTIKQLNFALSQIQTNQIHQFVLRQIFQGKGQLSQLHYKFYSRGAVAEGSKIEELLDSDLPHLRAEFEKAFASKDREKIREAYKEYSLEEYAFAKSLGLDLKPMPEGGTGGARRVFNRFGEVLFVAKPGDEGPQGVNNPKWYARIKQFFVSPRRCLRGISEPLSEVDSYDFDRAFDIDMVPPTMLRFVKSRQFKGKELKECSLQMYVDGCKTLKKFLKIPLWRSFLPRSLQRSHLKENKKAPKLPQRLIEKIAVHNALIGDIDCHWDNILVKEVKPLPPDHFLSKYDRGEAQAADVQEFVNKFFENKFDQDLLSWFLDSKEGIQLVKHDGGSSNPRYHPTGYLSQRNMYLFTVLPHFEAPFSISSKEMLSDRKVLQEVLEKKAQRALRNIMTQDVYDLFWAESGTLFNQWVNEEREEEYPLRLELIRRLLLAVNESERMVFDDALEHKKSSALKRIMTKDAYNRFCAQSATLFEKWINGEESASLKHELIERLLSAVNDREHHDEYSFYFSYHLQRILDTLQTQRERFVVLKKYVDSDRPMRDFFDNVRNQKDFDRELNELQRSK